MYMQLSKQGSGQGYFINFSEHHSKRGANKGNLATLGHLGSKRLLTKFQIAVVQTAEKADG